MRKGTQTLVMFVIGAAAGVAAGLLLAPEKGKITRRKIRRGVEDISEKSREWVDEAQEGLRTKFGDLSGRIRGR